MFDFESEVGVEVGVQNGRTRLQGVEGIEDGRPLFVFDVDQLQRCLGDVLVVGGHRRHTFAE